MLKKAVAFFLFFSFNSYAQICEGQQLDSSSFENYCSHSLVDFQRNLCEHNNTMGFGNEGGLFGFPTGVCWWHSQFLRNSTYLTYYIPECSRWNFKTKEGRKKLKHVLRNIFRMKNVEAIPGFRNLKEFTSDPYVKVVLQKYLQKWMAEDSITRLRWINGLEGGLIKDQQKRVKQQEKELSRIYESVINKHEITYAMVQYPGVESHAFLIFDIAKIERNGKWEYEIKVQDSNYQGFTYWVNGQQRTLERPYQVYQWKNNSWYSNGSKQDFRLFLQHNRHLSKMKKLVKSYCVKSTQLLRCP